jgi:phosphoribosylformylglycinamidine synthase
LIVTAFAGCTDVAQTLTPQLRRDAEVGETELLLIDLGEGANRLGGSALLQVFGQFADAAPDVAPQIMQRFFKALQRVRPQVLAYHDRSDGGLLATVAEMCFAGHVGVSLNLDGLCFDPLMNDVDGMERRPQLIAGRLDDRVLRALFSEELGAVLQIRRSDREAVMAALRAEGLGACTHVIGTLNTADELRIWRNAKSLFAAPRVELQRIWSEVSFRIASLRDDPDCAREEFDRLLDAEEPGLKFHVPGFVDGAPAVFTTRPKLAVLREQGVNGQVEMAAAFDRGGFDCVDVHMTDLQTGRACLSDFHGLAACGGFSYGDVLGAGQGWAKSILFNPRLRDEFAAFFGRSDTFALGVCNGCQMMSHLAAIIPGAEQWPTFQRNRSEQFEARFTMVEIPSSPSILLQDMAGWRLPVVVSHGEGRAELKPASSPLAALRYIDRRGAVAKSYPDNPNGSPDGLAGVTTADGRFTIMMPHPERVFRRSQLSWTGDLVGEHSPWISMFRNARRWLG